MKLIPTPYRILAWVLLLLAGVAFGYVQGISRESDRRDAQELVEEREDGKAFQRALANGKRHAANVAEWRNKARTYYRNWQEGLKNVPDNQLAECHQNGSKAGGAVLLSGTWVGMYNAAWMPELDQQGDSGGTSYSLVETGGATPREVLDNTRINAELCGEDRKRLDELIAHLTETE
jgi:hypothetical protein